MGLLHVSTMLLCIYLTTATPQSRHLPSETTPNPTESLQPAPVHSDPQKHSHVDINPQNSPSVHNLPIVQTTDSKPSDLTAKDRTTSQQISNESMVPVRSAMGTTPNSDLDQESFINFKSNATVGNEEKNGNEDEEEIEEKLMEKKNLVKEVTEFGLEKMKQLFDKFEQEIYYKGVFLERGSPGRYLAAFNLQTQQARHLARYGYAALQASLKLQEELNESKSRQDALNLTSTSTWRFPQLSLQDTALQEQCPLVPPRCPHWAPLFRTLDGTCNNWDKPWWGAVFQPLRRYLAPAYHDGLQAPRRSVRGGPLPSPRLVSTVVHWDRNIESPGISHMLMQWGQFLDHDLTASSQSRGFNGSVPRCCDVSPRDLHPECLPIEVPPNDAFYSRHNIRCLEFLRSAPAARGGCALGPREQINQVSSYLDASMVYGTTPADADSLRLFRNGMLKYTRQQQSQPLLPAGEMSKEELCRGQSFNCFMTGDTRANEQPGLVGLHIVFLRLHNRIARQLGHLNPHWSDERLYQETRRIVAAIMQHVTYREFLPVILGPEVMSMFNLTLLSRGYSTSYDPRACATATNSFTAAAYRFGHSLVQGRLLKWDSERQTLVNTGLLHEEMSNPGLHQHGVVSSLMAGLCNQPSQRRDQHLTVELTNHLFETPSFPAGLDLAAINIQRGRDHGLKSYNNWRRPCGLRKAFSWQELSNVMEPHTVESIRRVYSDVDDIDLFTGGLSELPVRGGVLGSVFACIVAQHFSNLKHGDRFWYENGNQASSFTSQQLQSLRRVTLSRLLCDTLDQIHEMHPFAFLTLDNDRNQRLSCRSTAIPFVDLIPWKENFQGKWHLQNMSSVHGSEGPELPDLPEPPSPPQGPSLSELPRPIVIDPDLEY